ncbi:hypothetical protein PMI01_02201 [Caulobacter sp. AP07]|uniref:hypothetical protein n=1 Tax=Caulobacter sp. AP07 TaxID=1144304 RepID=UPI0002722028|nr:hypothetical protein [Caulobacter sp. AP07]EJL33239.1 hypothetical protein PMI01_02201 [Caulobacter sp. AP07]
MSEITSNSEAQSWSEISGHAEQTVTGSWTYRGWTISLEPDGQWHAFSANYDASYEGPEDGWVDNGEKVSGSTIKDACDEIDAFIESTEAS